MTSINLIAKYISPNAIAINLNFFRAQQPLHLNDIDDYERIVSLYILALNQFESKLVFYSYRLLSRKTFPQKTNVFTSIHETIIEFKIYVKRNLNPIFLRIQNVLRDILCI